MRRWALACSLGIMAGSAGAADSCPALLNHSFPGLQDGRPQSLCQYQGKVVLVVNTASYCGFTSQYDGLEKMYARYKDQGLVVLGFPSNDFGAQEPGSNGEIAEFCRLTYGVKFPMLAKTNVVGPETNPFYRQLATTTGERPRWNFHKYLIGRDGRVLESAGATTAPLDTEFVSEIEAALASKSK